MKPLGPDARSLLDAASRDDEPTADDAARVRAKLAARLAVAAATTTVATKAAAAAGTNAAGAAGGAATTTLGAAGTTAGAGAAMGASSAGAAAKVLLAVALVGGSAASGAALVRSEATSRVEAPLTPSTRSAPARSARLATPPDEPNDPGAAVSPTTIESRLLAPPAVTPSVTPTAEDRVTETDVAPISAPSVPRAAPATEKGGSRDTRPVVAMTARSAAAEPSAKAPPEAASVSGSDGSSAVVPPDTVAEEAVLLRSANAALARGDATAALARLSEHEARFPRGALVEERHAARVFALCASGRADEARALASTFAAANPRSPLLPRVRSACSQGARTGR